MEWKNSLRHGYFSLVCLGHHVDIYTVHAVAQKLM